MNDRYSWTQGVYNILNRSREQNDEYYNIIFDRVIPEDKPLIKKLLDELDHGRLNYDTGNLLSRYGLFKDVSTDSTRKVARPVDFLLKGFKNSKKLALLIDPLSIKHYEFSEGFYDFIEEDPETYRHSTNIIENIAEKRVKNKIKEIMNGEKGELIEKATYYVHGDKNNKKIAEKIRIW